jgi:hypothetical protein
MNCNIILTIFLERIVKEASHWLKLRACIRLYFVGVLQSWTVQFYSTSMFLRPFATVNFTHYHASGHC